MATNHRATIREIYGRDLSPKEIRAELKRHTNELIKKLETVTTSEEANRLVAISVIETASLQLEIWRIEKDYKIVNGD
jgi:hypothetical protein